MTIEESFLSVKEKTVTVEVDGIVKVKVTEAPQNPRHLLYQYLQQAVETAFPADRSLRTALLRVSGPGLLTDEDIASIRKAIAGDNKLLRLKRSRALWQANQLLVNFAGKIKAVPFIQTPARTQAQETLPKTTSSLFNSSHHSTSLMPDAVLDRHSPPPRSRTHHVTQKPHGSQIEVVRTQRQVQRDETPIHDTATTAQQVINLAPGMEEVTQLKIQRDALRAENAKEDTRTEALQLLRIKIGKKLAELANYPESKLKQNKLYFLLQLNKALSNLNLDNEMDVAKFKRDFIDVVCIKPEKMASAQPSYIAVNTFYGGQLGQVLAYCNLFGRSGDKTDTRMLIENDVLGFLHQFCGVAIKHSPSRSL